MTRDLGDPPDWRQADAPQLWRFHLHYWDWAWGLAATRTGRPPGRSSPGCGDPGGRRCSFGRGDAWLPTRRRSAPGRGAGCTVTWSQAATSSRSSSPSSPLTPGSCAGISRSDVGGNHLVKDLKALAGLAVFFADDRLLRRALGRLTRQLAVQVLPDGGHYERAPAYHCQVLADLIDVDGLVRAAGGTGRARDDRGDPPDARLAG